MVVRLCLALMIGSGALVLAACEGMESEAPPAIDYSQIPATEAVHVLAASGNLAQLKEVLQQDPNLKNARSVRERTLLHTAALAGQNEVVQYLLSEGFNPDQPDDQGSLPAELALSEGFPETVRLLNQR